MNQTPEMDESLKSAGGIASEACREMQPMPHYDIDPLLIADCCELIGESHAAKNEWKLCANAHRMACWYYRKSIE